MNNRWQVSIWTKRKQLPGEVAATERYGWENIIRTQSIWRAAFAMIKAKRAGIGCVKLEWR